MPRILKPQTHGAGRRFAIVASEFNHDIVERLVAGALKTLAANGVGDGDVTIAWVPGAFELPMAARVLARTGQYAGVICCGAVIRGETRHDRYVCENAARGVAEASRETGVPCTFGVITAENRKQADDRSGPVVNRGAEAAEAALQMADLLPRLA